MYGGIRNAAKYNAHRAAVPPVATFTERYII